MKYIFFSFALVVLACNTSEKSVTETETLSAVDSSTTQGPEDIAAGRTIIPETGINCIHATATPVVKKSSFPQTTFQLQSDKQTGIETIQLENEDKVIIKNWGCDYYVLTFRFETSRFQEDPANLGFWYKRAVTLLNEINKGLDTPIDVIKGTERLVVQIENDLPNGYANLQLNEELSFNDETPRSFISIDKIEKLDEKRYAVTITFAKGPLK